MNTYVHRYRRELDRCREHFESLNLHQEKGYQFKFTTFSANLQNILPDIPISKHESLFQELLLQQVYATFDQQFLTANDLLQTKGPIQEFIQSRRPHIYCTFHLGSYRLLTSYLYRSGVDLVLLVGSSVFQQQQTEMWSTIHGLQKKHKLTNSFQILDAERTASTLQIIRELRAGKSLVIFIDGLTSTTGANRQEDKEIQVRLGNKHVWARKGVGFLSYVTKTPIVPVMSYREKSLRNVLSFQEPMVPNTNLSRDTYCQDSLQYLYDSFWKYLTRYPGQWEGWNYIHKFFDPQELERQITQGTCRVPTRKQKNVSFNQERYTICDLENAAVLFDKRLYVTYEISPDLRDFLYQIGGIDSPEDVLGTDMYRDLLSKQIIL